MRPTSNKSFTLIELLIVILILSIVSGAILAVFSSGLRIYKRVNMSDTRKADVLIALDKMETDLRNIFNINGINFVGDLGMVYFPGLVGQAPGRISYLRNPSTGYLTKIEQSYAQVFSGSSEAVKITELLAVDSIIFSYCYYDAVTKTFTCSDSWKEGLPVSVKIKIVLNIDEAKQEFNRIVIIPMAGK